MWFSQIIFILFMNSNSLYDTTQADTQKVVTNDMHARRSSSVKTPFLNLSSSTILPNNLLPSQIPSPMGNSSPVDKLTVSLLSKPNQRHDTRARKSTSKKKAIIDARDTATERLEE